MPFKHSELESLAKDGYQPYIEQGVVKVRVVPPAEYVPVKTESPQERLDKVEEKQDASITPK